MKLPMNAEQFAGLQTRAGLAASETSGVIDDKGVRAQWNYADGVLEATILHKPLFVTEGMIEDHFRKWAGLR